MKRYFLSVLLPSFVFAEDVLSSGDTAWMLVATALVMLMTPAGLALFYGGLTRSKNVLNTIGMSLGAYAVGTLVWVLVGYSIAFGDGDIVGSGKVLLSGITSDTLKGTIPELLFVAFQGTFAAIAVAIASGSMIERVKFSTYMVFAALWIVAVYAPVAHWAWGGGTSLNFAEMDFAGGTVVHLNAGVAGFVVAMMLGRRRDYGKAAIKPFSPILVSLGAALLWFGWFGFNAGSALVADGVASSAFMVTNVAASLGVIGWIVVEWFVYKKATIVGGASGAVAGLVAITPASGSAGVEGAIIIGLIGGVLGFIGVAKLKNMFKVDDSLDAFWIHGLVGIWGSVATAIFIADYAMAENYSMASQLVNQFKAIGLTVVYSAIATAVVYFIASALTGGGRVDDESENRGLDETVHGEKALNL
ncbi:MAG: ammonium transporter [Sulfurimonas sp. RIFCSPHIGHO2_12_FULL_36_9]|uniref:ammonium transporter n=1 Tax=unclassified Sulfurimonas TaxID=2623549 RepID=UPI0008BFB741|nr:MULTISPECIES: ammonium transporter [unclassified Sulfurimonas]OHD97717.1 MAG: ammonium transporter [Sulfurimonas sp. RIFCSPLOWO2_02_FULL_36_28]OHD97779.1 MAG: ammonium transporter [Sulfurimonas sp. RIFCSPHIGHO2_12_FULL_36_9]OHE01542.1 MAG: ammonium transporter [Sulfurimonas sp. RIFCSPLOWO2_12_36_12]OHE02841.1 MAG: ammonium transporter [Sulfurimonas sp. RIFCSPLOWO2_12_FULL_36_74]